MIMIAQIQRIKMVWQAIPLEFRSVSSLAYQSYEDTDTARFHSIFTNLTEYFNFYSRRNETATAVFSLKEEER